jgi:hypothetical protein
MLLFKEIYHKDLLQFGWINRVISHKDYLGLMTGKPTPQFSKSQTKFSDWQRAAFPVGKGATPTGI